MSRCGGGEGSLGCHCDAAGNDAEEEGPGYIDPERGIIVVRPGVPFGAGLACFCVNEERSSLQTALFTAGEEVARAVAGLPVADGRDADVYNECDAGCEGTDQGCGDPPLARVPC